MPNLGERIQKADWKKEKHVPVIEAPEEVKADEMFEIKVSLGKGSPTPTPQNTTFAGFPCSSTLRGTNSATRWGTSSSPRTANAWTGQTKAPFTRITGLMLL